MIHSATLVNDPFGDPGVYVDFRYRREAFLFDLGDIHILPPRKLLKIDYIFVSHTHMDHFIGFDHLLRISLGRDRRIHLYGPPKFLQNVEDKLHSYTWNLVANYTNNFELVVTEVHPDETISRRYRPFLDADADTAKRECHLTAGQAGPLAKRAGAKRLVVFHFSKYTGRGELLSSEAMNAFQGLS
jgi:ribonuclease BN (tRNA processing enzyme)